MPTIGEVERFILEDSNGEFYLISREMLAQAKVTGAQKAEVAKLVHGEHEVSGYVVPGQTLTFFNTPLAYRGSCACAFAGCQTRPLA